MYLNTNYKLIELVTETASPFSLMMEICAVPASGLLYSEAP